VERDDDTEEQVTQERTHGHERRNIVPANGGTKGQPL
jgi:hypothetical protein